MPDKPENSAFKLLSSREVMHGLHLRPQEGRSKSDQEAYLPAAKIL